MKVILEHPYSGSDCGDAAIVITILLAHQRKCWGERKPSPHYDPVKVTKPPYIADVVDSVTVATDASLRQ